MNKRNFIKSLGMKAGTLTVIMAGIGIGRSTVAEAAAKNSVTWEVPPGVTKIRVRSWTPDGQPDIDRQLNVEPNQTFRIDVVK